MFLQRLAECEQHQAKERLPQTAPQTLELPTLEHDPGLPKAWMTGGTEEQCCNMNCLPVLCKKQTALVCEIHTGLSPLAAAVRQGGKSCSVPVPFKSAQMHGTFGHRAGVVLPPYVQLGRRNWEAGQTRTTTAQWWRSLAWAPNDSTTGLEHVLRKLVCLPLFREV